MPSDVSKFESIRFMRHGNGFCSWWKQEQQDLVTTQCSRDEYIYNLLQADTTSYFFHQKYICM